MHYLIATDNAISFFHLHIYNKAIEKIINMHYLILTDDVISFFHLHIYNKSFQMIL